MTPESASPLDDLALSPHLTATLPRWEQIMAELREPGPHIVDVLRMADATGRPAVQPRCGVGGHREMLRLLEELSTTGADVLTVTIDSHTRLRQYATAQRLLCDSPGDLNGYPLVAHGWRRGRELRARVPHPLQVRHGSPDARDLFAIALASGITSFEGGGIDYNLPYSKDIPLRTTLGSWRRIDAVCGVLAKDGVLVDRELFGTLSAVLMPPSISLAITLLEAAAAAREGVRCVSPAYPQSGEMHQDIAALRAIRVLGQRYLGPDIEVFPVLHEFMGPFPRTPQYANFLIMYGGLTARLGRASKVVSKTAKEGYGIPDAAANTEGILNTILGTSDLLDFVRVDEDRIAEEESWILQEVGELVEPLFSAEDLLGGVVEAFQTGRLDIPFSASVHAHSDVVPARDRGGAVRYADPGALPFSSATRSRHARQLSARAGAANRTTSLIERITRDINYFLDKERTVLPAIDERPLP
ncbi:methylaspartate mutase [Nonomuraea basaltis]|nr:methylaspartate mutase [Nonomuraea basaltis]